MIAHTPFDKSLFLIAFRKSPQVGSAVAVTEGAQYLSETEQTQAEWKCWPRRMLMGSDHAVAGNAQTELGGQSKSLQREEYTSDNELENRIKSLDKIVDSLLATPDQVSSSGKPHVRNLVNDLRVKIKASHNLLRVAKVLSEPARESMLSKIRDSLNDLEESVASHFGVKTS
jgi:hypothetical protein